MSRNTRNLTINVPENPYAQPMGYTYCTDGRLYGVFPDGSMQPIQGYVTVALGPAPASAPAPAPAPPPPPPPSLRPPQPAAVAPLPPPPVRVEKKKVPPPPPPPPPPTQLAQHQQQQTMPPPSQGTVYFRLQDGRMVAMPAGQSFIVPDV